MKESIEEIRSGREILKNLESENKYVFHGTPNPDIAIFEPRQAYTIVNGEKAPDDKPGIHASPIADIAIFMALVNKENYPEKLESGFDNNKELNFRISSKDAFKKISESSLGYVYVFSNEDFERRMPSQSITYKNVVPIERIEVNEKDLPKNIEIK